MPVRTLFGSYEFEIKCDSASALQCGLAPLASTRAWICGWVVCWNVIEVRGHGMHVESDVFMGMDRWEWRHGCVHWDGIVVVAVVSCLMHGSDDSFWMCEMARAVVGGHCSWGGVDGVCLVGLEMDVRACHL